MAKSKKVKNLTADEATVPVSSLPETERQDLLIEVSSSAVEEPKKDGESNTVDNRLPYPPRTQDGQKAFLELGKSIPSFLWIARAKNVGHSLSAEEVREVIAYDGPEEVTCAAPSGQCTYRFRPIKIAYVDQDNNGSLLTDERLVSETNPTGVVYRGAYLVVPTDPSNKYSDKRVLGPLCQHDQRSLMGSYKDAGWHVRSFGKAEAEAFVASENAKHENSRNEYLERKKANARAAGLLTGDGRRVEKGGRRFPNNPHQAVEGSNFRLNDIFRVSQRSK